MRIFLNHLRTIFVLIIFLGITKGQIEFFGYYEAEIDQIVFTDQKYTFGYNKLRLDFTSRPSENLYFGGNLNIQKYFGKTTWDFIDFLPKKIKEEFDPGQKMTITIRDSLYLDNLYLRLTLRRLDLTIGRQPISLGTGYAWNPLDIFNKKELLDPTYEQPGVNALRFEVPLGERSGIDLILAPDSSWEMSKKMLQLKLGAGSFDISLSWARQYHLFPYWSSKESRDIEKTHELISFAGASLVGQIWELGLWAEILRSYNASENYGEYVAGIDHTFDNGFYLMVEYLHNKLGANKDQVEFINYAHYFAGESNGIMENYIFIASQFALSDFLGGSLFGFANLDDGSFSVVPQIEWNAVENVSFSLMLSEAGGSKNSEFGSQGRTIRLRVKTYF